MKNLLVRAILFTSILAAAACGPAASLLTPPGFAVLDQQREYLYRATSAEGVVIAIRAENNAPRGNLDFWAEALDRQLRHGGYLTDGAPSDVRTTGGLTGRQLKYLREENGRKNRFWIAVFVTGDRVWVVEAGGDVERFQDKTQLGIQRAIESFRAG